MSEARNQALIDDLLALPGENAWVEFKHNNADPTMIGQRISAISNSARLSDQHFGYILWGIEDKTKEIVGTAFEPSRTEAKNEPLEFYLAKRLQPSIPIKFIEVDRDEMRLVLLEIPAATTAPVEFDREARIRIGSATPRLSDYPERQQELWRKLQPYVWEKGVAAQFVDGDTVLAQIDYVSYFELTQQPLPDNRAGIFDRLASDRVIEPDVGGKWNISNLGAILFAKQLNVFDQSNARKAVRFTAYDGPNRASPVTHRREGVRGYANGFEGLISFVSDLLPVNEHIGSAFRVETTIFPMIALRELIANALIHQDMTVTGAGPMIELFKDRIEITNPGIPLIEPERFIDSPPRSRNEALASMMRRMRLCEEQGSGIDKVIASVEMYQMPPPDFRIEGGSTRVTLFAPRKFADMTPDERIRACYQHSVLKFVSGDRMKNSSLRERFGVESQNAAQVSNVIKHALERGVIRPADPNRPKSGYIPSWA